MRSNFTTEDECIQYLKERFTFVPQYTGEDVHYIESREKTEANFASQTTNKVGFHNDGYDYNIVPTHIALYCIEDNYKDGETFYSNFVDALSILDESQIETLINKDLYFKTDPAIFYNAPGFGVKSSIMKDDVLRYSYAYVKRLDNDKVFESALDKLNLELCKIKESIKLKSGDLVIIDNRHLVHGREGFTGSRKIARFWLTME